MRMWRAPSSASVSRNGVAGGVALRVVGHHRLDRAAALLAQPRRGAPQGGRDGVGVLGRVQLAVGQAGVVVDDADDDGLAGVAGLWRSSASPVRPVARAGRTSAARRRRCAAAPRPRPTHSGAWSAALAAPRAATRRDACSTFQIVERCRPVRELQPHRPPVRLARAHRGSPAPARRSTPTDTTAAPAAASRKHALDARSAGSAARQRCHHRCAVAGATLRAAAAALSVDPRSINVTSSRRPCSPSLHLPSSMSGLLRRVSRR